MYCENCQFEIEDHQETQCPLCGGPLIDSAAPGGGFQLDLADPQGAFVLEDDDDDEAAAQPQGRQESNFAAPDTPIEQQAYADTATNDILDQALEEFDPMVDEHFQKKKSKSSSKLLLLILLVCVLAGAGYYYYFFMMDNGAAPEDSAPVPVQVVKPRPPAAPAENQAQAPAAPAPAPAAPPAAATPDPKAPAEPATSAAQNTEPPKAVVQPGSPEAQQPQEKPAEAVAAKEPEKAAQQQQIKPAQPKEKAPVPAAEPAPAKKAPVQEPVAPGAASQPAAVKTGKTVYSIMTDSFRSQKNAESEMHRLRKFGYDARIMEIDLGRKGVFYRVLVGAWPSRSEALPLADELRSKGGKRAATVMPVQQ